MKNITVSVDDEVYRKARVRAAERNTSLSRVVADHLKAFASQASEQEQRAATLRALYARVDERLKGLPREPYDPDWRGKMYDERFDETVLGRSLKPKQG